MFNMFGSVEEPISKTDGTPDGTPAPDGTSASILKTKNNAPNETLTNDNDDRSKGTNNNKLKVDGKHVSNPNPFTKAKPKMSGNIFKFLFVGNWEPKIVIPKMVFWLLVVIFIMGLVWGLTSTFENKETYDPYGTGIRHFVSRDDTGAINTSLEERQFGSKPLKIEPLQIERLTSSPEPPNFSKHYNIEANIKDGTVMIERENFENMALNNDKLNNAMQGL
jgi:hypothetical protein